MVAESAAREDDPDASLIGAMSREIVREAVTSMPRLFISAIVAYGAISYFTSWLLRTGTAMAVAGGITPVPIALMSLASLFAIGFIESAILSSVAIAVHRLILRDDTNTGVIMPFNRRGMSFTLWVMLLRFPLFFVGGVSAFFLRSYPGLWLLLAPIILASVVVGVRTSLVFPAIAIDAQCEGWFDRVASAWRMSRQRFWRLVGSTIWAMLPLIVVIVVAAIGLALVMSFIMPTADGHSSFAEWSERIRPVTSTISSVFFAALGAAALSWNYRIVTAAPRPQPAFAA